MKSNYLGKWYKNHPKNEEEGEEIEIIDIIDDNAITSTGVKIPLIQLDHTDDYWKMQPFGEAENSSLKQFAAGTTQTIPVNQPQGGSVLGNINNEPTNGLPNFQHTPSVPSQQIINDPVATMIRSLIQIQKSKGKTSEFPVQINLKFDFDIISVIKMSMESGASDIEIIQHVLSDLPFTMDDVKRSIVNELLNPEDVELVMANREPHFNEVLSEELSKGDGNEYETLK